MQYIMYVFLQSFRIRTHRQRHKPEATPTGGVSAPSNTRKAMDVMHLFILCVNLLTSFVFLSILSALHETDGGIYIFNVFLYLVLSKLSSVAHRDFLLLFLIFWFSNRALSLVIFL